MVSSAMFDQNPVRIQWSSAQGVDGNVEGATGVPLFLVHDGGGTIFNYFLLEDLQRDVYGINDPMFGTDEAWEGGISSMAKQYVSYVRSAISSGPVILGGWSLGGLLSLEMARILREDKFVNVLGIILVDSPCPLHWRKLRSQMIDYKVDFPPSVSEKTRQAVNRRFKECDRLIDNWDLSYYNNGGNQDATVTSGSLANGSIKKVEHGRVYAYHPLGDNSKIEMVQEPRKIDDVGAGNASSPRVEDVVGSHPPTVLVRATTLVPRPKLQPNALIDVDVFRNSKLLGWESCSIDFIKTVYDVDGHHFDIFETTERVIHLSQIIKNSCQDFETRADSSKV